MFEKKGDNIPILKVHADQDEAIEDAVDSQDMKISKENLAKASNKDESNTEYPSE